MVQSTVEGKKKEGGGEREGASQTATIKQIRKMVQSTPDRDIDLRAPLTPSKLDERTVLFQRIFCRS